MSIKVACLKRLHTKENCLHTHLHTHAHIRTHAHTNTHKHTRAHTNLHAQEPFYCHGGYLYDSVPSAGAVLEGRKKIMELLTSCAAMRELKLVIFMVRRFVFMHPAIHPATHAPSHPSFCAIIPPSVQRPTNHPSLHPCIQPSIPTFFFLVLLSQRGGTMPNLTRSWRNWVRSLACKARVSWTSQKL